VSIEVPALWHELRHWTQCKRNSSKISQEVVNLVIRPGIFFILGQKAFQETIRPIIPSMCGASTSQTEEQTRHVKRRWRITKHHGFLSGPLPDSFAKETEKEKESEKEK
jgi:hypothetical protein